MTSDSMPLGRMLAVFLAVLVAANVVLGVIAYVFPDLPVPSSIGIVMAMIGGMSAGQLGTKALNRRLTFAEKAIFSALATVLSVALGIGMIWAIFAYFGAPFTLENFILVMTGEAVPVGEITEIVAWIAPIVLVVYLLITYFGAAMGSRNQMKLQEKLAAKAR
jgi:hypothetical protein